MFGFSGQTENLIATSAFFALRNIFMYCMNIEAFHKILLDMAIEVLRSLWSNEIRQVFLVRRKLSHINGMIGSSFVQRSRGDRMFEYPVGN